MNAQPNQEPRRQRALQRAREIGETVKPQGYDRFDPDQAARGRRRFRISLFVMLTLVIGLCWIMGMMLGFW